MNELLELAAIAERTLRLKERWADLSDAGRARLAAMVALAEATLAEAG